MDRLLGRRLRIRAVAEAARQARFDVLRRRVERPVDVDYSSESAGFAGDVDSDVESIDNEVEQGRDGGDERPESGEEMDLDPGNVSGGEDRGDEAGNDEYINQSDEENGSDRGNEINSSEQSSDEGDGVQPQQDVEFQNDNAREQYVINSIREWALRPGVLSMTKLDDLLHRLNVAFPNIPLSYKTLLQCDYGNDISITDLPSGGQLWYKSIKANLDSLDLREYLLKYQEIIIDVNMDGLPLSKSSKLKFWPILGHLVHTDNEPFIIDVYCGTHDPVSVDEYLEKYVNELLNFAQHGYEFEGQVYPVAVRNYILDKLARSFIKCIIGHGGYCSCEKCTVFGEYVDRMTFVDLNAPLRTDLSFSERAQPRHHSGVSPLDRFGGMVSTFRLDPMHLLYQGVMKRLLNHWLHVVGQCKIPVDIQALISEVFEFISSYCPSDFNRRPRSLNDFKNYKATEFRRILLYDGMLAFKDLIDDNIYEHFLLLQCACYIMSSTELLATKAGLLDELLRNFVSHSVRIYGTFFVVYNVHSLIHLPTECIGHGTLENFSAFKYENRLKSIKDALKSMYRPLAQLARRDLEKTASKVTLSGRPPAIVLSLRTRIFNEIMPGDSFSKMSVGNVVLRVGRRDSCFKTRAGDVAILKNIVRRQRKIYLIGLVLNSTEDFYDYPVRSSELGIYHVSQLNHRRRCFRIRDVHSKCYLMPDGEKFLCVPILHSVSTFQNL